MIKLDYWLHDADREIQSTTGDQNNPVGQGDQQQDRNNRLSISYQQNNRIGLLKAGGGVVSDRIVFNENPGDVLRYTAFVNHQYRFANQWNIQLGADWNHIIGKLEEYGGDPIEDRTDVTASLQREFSRVRMSVTLRQPFITGIEAPLLPYAGAEFLLVKNKDHSVRLSANASKNFRAPTLNDRYWQNAGRKDLRPETSHATEIGLTWQHQTFKLSSSAFYQVVDNWIQWTPTSGSGVYRPENVKQVNARGFENAIEYHWAGEALSIRIKGTYQFTRSTTERALEAEIGSLGKQLIYTPLHTASGFFITQVKSWSFNLLAQYSGKRFTESTNAPGYSLKPFAIADLSLGKSFVAGRSSFQTRGTVKNIFNTTYQLYSGRAMPGRHYNLQISYQLNHKSNKL
jgi:iron complex outermembrane receptor protein